MLKKLFTFLVPQSKTGLSKVVSNPTESGVTKESPSSVTEPKCTILADDGKGVCDLRLMYNRTNPTLYSTLLRVMNDNITTDFMAGLIAVINFDGYTRKTLMVKNGDRYTAELTILFHSITNPVERNGFIYREYEYMATLTERDRLDKVDRHFTFKVRLSATNENDITVNILELLLACPPYSPDIYTRLIHIATELMNLAKDELDKTIADVVSKKESPGEVVVPFRKR